MNQAACKYNQPDYWEWLLKKKDVWNDLFAKPDELHNPLFVNTCVADESRDFLDNNWACYPDLKALLGFIQYIFLPAVYYFVIHQECARLLIPIGSREELVQELEESGSPYQGVMTDFLNELNGIWEREENEQAGALADFCDRFNRYWERQDCQLYLHVFFGVAAVADCVKSTIWCEELFREETGLTYRQFDKLCARFETEDIAKRQLLRLLNQRIGCIA